MPYKMPCKNKLLYTNKCDCTVTWNSSIMWDLSSQDRKHHINHDKLVLKPKELHLIHFGGDLNIYKDTNHVKTQTPKIQENWRRNQHEASFFNVKDHPNKNQNDKHGNYIFFPSKLRSEVEAWLQWRTCKCAAASAKKLTQDKRSPPDSGKLTVSHHVNTTILSQTKHFNTYMFHIYFNVYLNKWLTVRERCDKTSEHCNVIISRSFFSCYVYHFNVCYSTNPT